MDICGKTYKYDNQITTDCLLIKILLGRKRSYLVQILS